MAGLTLADLGGPVHPQETQNADGSVSVWCGMNLRDYFAAAALTGLLAISRDWVDEITSERIAAWAYEQADAMLAARERKEG
jgi:hypothetical protein